MAADRRPAGRLQEFNAKDAVKVILLGDAAAGKTKLVERFLVDDYRPYRLSTYALTLFNHEWETPEGKKVPITIWDTAGQEQFQQLHPSYFYKAHAAILVFDVTRKQTYKNLEQWYNELREYTSAIPVVVVANKVDTDYSITNKSFNFATKRNLPFFFVSASDGTNVVQVFKEVIESGMEYKQNPPEDFYSQVMNLLENKDEC